MPGAFDDLIPGDNARLMSYGPIDNEFTNATMVGPQGNALQSYDAAVSPNMSGKYPFGSWFKVPDGSVHRVADASYYSPGRPTSGTVELRDRQDMGRGKIQSLGGPFADLVPAEKSITGDLGIPSPTLSQEVGPPQPVQPPATDARIQHLIDSSHIGSQRDLEDIAARLHAMPSGYDTRDKFTAAIGNNLTPLVMHPLESAMSMLPTKENTLEPIEQMFTNPKKAFSRDVPIGSQEWYNELVGNLGMLATFKAPDLVKSPRLAEPALPEAAKPEAAPEPQPAAPVAGTEDFARVDTTPQPTHELTRQAIDWQNKLQGERAALDRQGQIAQAVSGSVPRDISDRIAEIDAEIKAGYNLTPAGEHAIPTQDEFTEKLPREASSPSGVSGQQRETANTGESGLVRPANNDVGAESGRNLEQPQAGEATGETAGTSNRVNAETYGADVVPSGKGAVSSDLLDNARAAIRAGTVDPYSILSKSRGHGIATKEEYAVLAAEHERLVNDAVAKQKADDPTAPQAVQAAEDFAKAIQPHKTAASDLMRLFQGDLNYDLGTPFGIDQYMKAEIGRGIRPSEAPKFQRMAQGIRQAEGGVTDAVARSDVRVRSRYAKVADISMEDAAARVRALLKDCQV